MSDTPEWLRLAQAIILVAAGVVHILYVGLRFYIYTREAQSRREQSGHLDQIADRLIGALGKINRKAEE